MGLNRHFKSGDKVTVVVCGITYHGRVMLNTGKLCRILIEFSEASGKVVGLPALYIKSDSLRFEYEKFDIE